MLLSLKYLLKGPFDALKSSESRAFLRLLARYGDKERHKKFKAKFNTFEIEALDSLSFVWQYKEIFADEYYKFKSEKPSPIILDCGANIGLSVLYFKSIFPNSKIIAFEVIPEIASILAANISANKIENVEIIAKAVWENNGGISMANNQDDTSSLFSEGDKMVLPSVRLKDYLEKESEIDLLKIDIEGAETVVLEDCKDSLGNVKNLFIEYHSYFGHEQSLSKILQILEIANFRYYVDTNQHRLTPLINHGYRGNNLMDLQLNIWAWKS